MYVQLGQILDKRYKKTKKTPTATSEELGAKTGSGAKAGYCACPLNSTPPEGWAKHLSHPSGLTPGHTPALTPEKEQACPPQGANEQGNLLLVLAPLPAAAEAPIKPCLNYLSGL